MQNITFILVEPETGANIGAAARAIKTMGFSKLILVNPNQFPSNEASYMAHASQEILDNALLVPSLAAAKASCSFLIGTAKQGRHLRRETISSRDLGSYLHTRDLGQIGIVFGRESSGLTNEELELCDLISSVALAVKEPSLNLGQAVMLFAYELAIHLQLANTRQEWEHTQRLQSEAEFSYFKQRTEHVLQQLGLNTEKKTFQAVLGRIPLLNFSDMRLLQHLYDRIETHVTKRC